MAAIVGKINYNRQIAGDLEDRSTFDQSNPYTVNCNLVSLVNGGGGCYFCLVEGPGYYDIGADGSKVLLAKDVSCRLNGCYVDFYCPSSVTFSSGVGYFDVVLYIGNAEGIQGTDELVYLNRFYISPGFHVKVRIPDVSGFVVPSGKNICCNVTQSNGITSGSIVCNGHFVCTVDD